MALGDMQPRQGKGRRLKAKHILATTMLVTLFAAIPSVFAEEVSREQYKAAAEPICKENAEANKNILKGVRAKVREGKLKAAGGQFTRAATALEKTLKRIKALPKPERDVERLTEWHRRVGEEVTLLRGVGKALIAEKRHRAEVLSAKLTSNANLTNAIVVPFGFTYCRLEPTKYA